MVATIIFVLILAGATVMFSMNIRKIIRNINMGRDLDRSDNSSQRWSTMIRVALGQSKMVVRPIAGVLHILVYAGFVIINLEVLEIVLDGIFGTHRLFSFMGGFYYVLIDSFEILGFLVLVSCAIFLVRRNIMKLPRFQSPEMKGWPKSDANYILIAEILLMTAFLTMNAADSVLMQLSPEMLAAEGLDKYAGTGLDRYFVVSGFLTGMLPDAPGTLAMIERGCWWFHIIGILAFLNYLPYSKHLHIIFAFPNTYYSNLNPMGRFTNMESVKSEVELMMDPEADPYATPAPDPDAVPQAFGAKDVTDLTWKQLMDSYSCTECGRCTSSCPANLTGKLLSPRKIMMDTRDRVEELGKHRAKNGAESHDDKKLVHDYITPEELWACTTCNACTDACPVNIDPLSIIVDLRRFLVMEESAAPSELNTTFTNIENNGAPWQFAQADRLNWASEE